MSSTRSDRPRSLKASLLTVALGLALAATAIAPSIKPALAADGGTVVVASTQVPRHFNGAVQSGMATAMPSSQIFASPLRYDDNWKPQPYLAKSWETSADGLSVTLKLVDNALFHDGKPVTSEDVAFSIMTIKSNHPFQTMLAAVDKVDTPDPLTAIIRLKHPHPALLLAMSPALMPILPKHVYGDGQDVKSHPANLKPVGSGPYRLTDYKQGEFYTLEKFDKFFIPGRPKLDKIVVRLVSDANAAVVSLERGDVNVLPFVAGVRDIERIEKMPSVVITNKGFDGVEMYKLDLAKSQKLLDDAGLTKKPDGSRMTLTIDYIPGSDEQQRNVAEYLRSQLKRAGINLEVRAAADFPTWAQRVSNYDFDLTMDTVFNWGDPVIGVDRTYLSSNIRKGIIWSNTQQYSNPKVDDLLAKAAQETSPEKRKALYSDFQKTVVTDAPIYFINAVPYHNAFSKGLGGLPTSIWGMMSPLDELYWEVPPRT